MAAAEDRGGHGEAAAAALAARDRESWTVARADERSAGTSGGGEEIGRSDGKEEKGWEREGLTRGTRMLTSAKPQ